MRDAATIRGLQTSFEGFMADTAVISLREIARQLAYLNGATSPDVDRLLDLLQEGRLEAGFRVPGRVVGWIEIPKDYWVAISRTRFSSIKYIAHSKTKTGSYQVSPSEFAEEYAAALSKRFNAVVPGETQGELESAIRACSGKYDVVVLEEHWSAYLKTINEEMPVKKPTRAKPGRPESQSWRPLCVIIGDHLYKHATRHPGDKPNLEAAAQEIYDTATKELLTSKLVAKDTIRDVIADILKRP
jgi:hypothetical protein